MTKPEPIPEEFRDAFLDTMKHTVTVGRVANMIMYRFLTTEDTALKMAEMIVDLIREEYEK